MRDPVSSDRRQSRGQRGLFPHPAWVRRFRPAAFRGGSCGAC